MELVSVEVGPDTGKTIGEDGRAFRPAITTVKSVDEPVSAAAVALTASSAPATQLIPNTARRTRTALMLFYPEPGRHLTPANAKAFARTPNATGSDVNL
jgi:hypothetical protein